VPTSSNSRRTRQKRLIDAKETRRNGCTQPTRRSYRDEMRGRANWRLGSMIGFQSGVM
jgi:hypothetical protein